MILLNSEKQCIYMYRGRGRVVGGREEEEEEEWLLLLLLLLGEIEEIGGIVT